MAEFSTGSAGALYRAVAVAYCAGQAGPRFSGRGGLMTTTRAHDDPQRVIDQLDLHVRDLVRREGGAQRDAGWSAGCRDGGA